MSGHVITYAGAPDVAFQKIQAYFATLPPFPGQDPNGLKCDAGQCRMSLKGAGFEAEIRAEKSPTGASVIFNLTLGLFLKPLRGRIESEVLGHLRRALEVG